MKEAFRSIYVLAILLLPFIIHAQSESKKYEIGVNAGTYIYLGDLTPPLFGSFKTPGFVIGINGSRQLNYVLSLRLDLSIGKLKGDEATYSSPAYRQERAFSFSSSITETSVSVVYRPYWADHKISPYVFAGGGLAFVDIERDYSAFNSDYFDEESGVSEGLTADINHSLPGLIPHIPLGVGVRYNISEKFSLNTEVAYRLTSNDYLDGFSHAANPKLKDNYYKYSIGVVYSPGNKNKLSCPVVK
jgi:opacity protein-like surface antigen